MKEYIEERAQIMKEFRPDDNIEDIYSEIVNDQKQSNKFTPLHFAIKFKNLPIIRSLIWDYNADINIENKDGHDAIEYLHIGDISHTISAPLMDKIDDLLNKKTKSIRYDKNQVFNKYVREQEEKEREALRQAINQFRLNVINSGRDIRSIFEMIDLDHNGTLSPDEIKAAFILLGIEGDADKVLKYSDTNKDGRIDYDEFCNFIYQTQSEMESAIGRAEYGETESRRDEVESRREEIESIREEKEEETKRFEFDSDEDEEENKVEKEEVKDDNENDENIAEKDEMGELGEMEEGEDDDKADKEDELE